MSNLSYLRQLKGQLERNLQLLEMQRARHGINVPLSLLNEIEHCEQKIDEVRQELVLEEERLNRFTGENISLPPIYKSHSNYIKEMIQEAFSDVESKIDSYFESEFNSWDSVIEKPSYTHIADSISMFLRQNGYDTERKGTNDLFIIVKRRIILEADIQESSVVIEFNAHQEICIFTALILNKNNQDDMLRLHKLLLDINSSSIFGSFGLLPETGNIIFRHTMFVNNLNRNDILRVLAYFGEIQVAISDFLQYNNWIKAANLLLRSSVEARRALYK